MELTVTIKFEENEMLKVENSKKGSGEPIRDHSMYARFFDESRPGWTRDAHVNHMFLRSQQAYANDLLKLKGHMFLNDVYEMLGIPKTKIGQVVGWVYEVDNAIGDNYIDFGILEKCNSEFVSGDVNVALLDFNVDGMILDRI